MFLTVISQHVFLNCVIMSFTRICRVKLCTAVVLCTSNLFYITLHLNNMLHATYTILHNTVVHDCL
jgi:hypothetical protein